MSTERDELATQVERLNDELSEIDERRAAIKGQIEKAQAEQHITGQYADADWFRRAKGALRHLGVERADVCRELGDGNRRLRALNASLNQNLFREAVIDVVGPDAFERIVARHQQLRNERVGA